MRSPKVPFHENGRKYFWHIPSRRVTNEQGELVASDCYNLERARTVVRILHRRDAS